MFRPMTSKLSEVGLESVSATFSPPSKHIKGRLSNTAQPSPYVPAAKTPESMPTDIYSIATPVDTTHFVSYVITVCRLLYKCAMCIVITKKKRINNYKHIEVES